MPICKHCREEISGKKRCSLCDSVLIEQCLVCHREIAHGRIKVQNIHIVGSGAGSIVSGLDKDPDMFGRADS